MITALSTLLAVWAELMFYTELQQCEGSSWCYGLEQAARYLCRVKEIYGHSVPIVCCDLSLVPDSTESTAAATRCMLLWLQLAVTAINAIAQQSQFFFETPFTLECVV